MIRRCIIPDCPVSEDTNSSRIYLTLDHIVPRALFPSSYKFQKKYDMIEIDGQMRDNREYLCLSHHQKKTELDIIRIRFGKTLNELEKKEYRIKLWKEGYSKLHNSTGENGNTSTAEEKRI